MKENSIEEEIKIALDKFLDNKDKDSAILIVEKFILGNYILIGRRTNIAKDSLRYILSDYKRLLKENEELKRKNEELKVLEDDVQDKNIAYIDEPEFDEKYITKQKIKDKIQEEIKYHGKNISDIENITMFGGKTIKEETEIEFNKYAIFILKKILHELIEEEK